MPSKALPGLVLTLISIIPIKSQWYCRNESSCEFSNFTANSTHQTMYCYGDSSCQHSNMQSHSTAACYGSFSCFGSTLYWIKAVYCYGSFSCANASTHRTGLYCAGEQSCINSKITNFYWNNFDLYCEGARSCANANISVSYSSYYDIHMEGSLSGMNAQIMCYIGCAVHFLGSYSGYNTTITCYSTTHSYRIYCYGNGCNRLNLQFANNCSFEIDCNYAEYSSICPNGYQTHENLYLTSHEHDDIVDNINFLPSLVDISMSTLENSKNFCHSPAVNATLCSNNEQRAKQSIDVSGPICCTGRESCADTLNITSLIDNNSNSNDKYNYNISIRCDGFGSCGDCKNFILAKSNGAANIYMSGMKSARAIYYENSSIATTVNGNVFCNGEQSCVFQTQIQNGNNLYCNGASACYASTGRFGTLISKFVNIYSYGRYASARVQMTDVTYVQCGGYQSCAYVIISNVYQSVYGSNYKVFLSSNISNVAHNVVGMGFQALYQSNIFNATNVCFDLFFIFFVNPLTAIIPP